MSHNMYGYYNDLRRGTNPVRRAGSVDVFVDPSTDEEVGICHIYSPLWLSDDPYTANSAAAILLALHHFNTGNGSIASSLDGINSRCPVRLTLEFENTEGSDLKALSILSDKVSGADSCSSDIISPPCAVLGPTLSTASRATSLLSSSHQVPQISFESTHSDLNNRAKYPFFSRVTPDDDKAAEASFHYLSKEVGIKHCVVIYIENEYGIAYLRKFQKMAEDGSIEIAEVSYPPVYNKTDVENMITKAKQSEYKYFFGIIHSDHFNDILEEASRQGLVGGSYVWMMGTDAKFNKTLDKGSILIGAYQGVGFLQVAPNRENTQGEHAFEREWRHLDNEAKAHIRSNLPSITNVSMDTLFNIDYSTSKSWVAYDTVVAIGLAACEATRGDEYFDGTELNREIMNSSFVGASGDVQIDESTGSRSLATTRFEVINLRRSTEISRKITSSSTRSAERGKEFYFETVPSVSLQYRSDGTGWNATLINPFVYHNGATESPKCLPPINNGAGIYMHYIGNLRLLAYVLFPLVAFFCFCFGTWVIVKRKERVVRASQPIFLIMICVGVLVMSLSMITLSIDDQFFSQEICDFACMATPWLICIGYTISISALFSKTWRINKVLNNPNQFKRVKVEVKDVMAPFALFITLNIIILICWSVKAPLTFVRTLNKEALDIFKRSISSYGKCTAGSNGIAESSAFGATLGLLNFIIVCFTSYQACRARNISTDYSESKYIGMCIASQLQAFIIGIPIILLMSSSEESHLSTFLVGSMIIFVLSMVTLLLMFVPKIHNHRKHNTEKEQKKLGASLGGADGLRFHVYNAVSFNNSHSSNTVESSEHEDVSNTQENPLCPARLEESVAV